MYQPRKFGKDDVPLLPYRPAMVELLELVFGRRSGAHIVFGLNESDGNFVHGRIVIHTGEERIQLDERNGIESLALTMLRADVADLLVSGGTIYFGDHDYSSMVEILHTTDGLFAVVDLPSEDRWDLRLDDVTEASLIEAVGVVDEAERRFGALDGLCGGCGTPTRTWQQLR